MKTDICIDSGKRIKKKHQAKYSPFRTFISSLVSMKLMQTTKGIYSGIKNTLSNQVIGVLPLCKNKQYYIFNLRVKTALQEDINLKIRTT